MNVIFLLADSLNRSYLSTYGNDWIRTPNFDRLAERSCVFESHFINSAPCMPARRDIWSGRVEFPWRTWGPLEAWDPSLPRQVHQAGNVSCLVTDHYHLWERGSGNFHVDFRGCEFIRGHEADNWKTHPVEVPPEARKMVEERGEQGLQYVRNTAHLRGEKDYFAPRTLTAAAEWLDANHGHRDFLLMIDEFDVHEPFHVPEPYRSMYTDPALLDRGFTYWPKYGPAANYSEEEVAFIRGQYAGKVAMLDRWLGVLLDRMDRYNLWENTLFVLTTDHGHHLGEHGHLGKNSVFLYPHFTNIPLLAHCPGSPHEGRRHRALTGAVDLNVTMLDALGLQPDPSVHGRSLLPVLRGESGRVRDGLICGYWGRGFYYTDGEHYLCKAPAGDNAPLYEYGTDLEGPPWSRHQERYAGAECGRYLPHRDVPVYRVPRTVRHTPDHDGLYALAEDRDCARNLWDEAPGLRREMLAGLEAEMRSHQVPEEHYARLGLRNA